MWASSARKGVMSRAASAMKVTEHHYRAARVRVASLSDLRVAGAND